GGSQRERGNYAIHGQSSPKAFLVPRMLCREIPPDQQPGRRARRKRSRDRHGIMGAARPRQGAPWHQSRLLKWVALHYRPAKLFGGPHAEHDWPAGRSIFGAGLSTGFGTGFAAAQSKVTI